jgi:hypothetical protein
MLEEGENGASGSLSWLRLKRVKIPKEEVCVAAAASTETAILEGASVGWGGGRDGRDSVQEWEDVRNPANQSQRSPEGRGLQK